MSFSEWDPNWADKIVKNNKPEKFEYTTYNDDFSVNKKLIIENGIYTEYKDGIEKILTKTEIDKMEEDGKKYMEDLHKALEEERIHANTPGIYENVFKYMSYRKTRGLMTIFNDVEFLVDSDDKKILIGTKMGVLCVKHHDDRFGFMGNVYKIKNGSLSA